tara:strand:- start:1467 stop:2399 length:933 start_codon:yes stop_codon:yes gene_type:complete
VNFKPILIVPGEKKSIFFEIFFKSIKRKTYLSPLILICEKSTLEKEKKKFKFKKKIDQIFLKEINNKKIVKKKIYVIDVKNQNANYYVRDCFEVAFKLIKDGFSDKFINGPINKTKTLKKKYLGITEYVAKKFNQKRFAMLIYNKKLSVCPVTTHLPLNIVSKKITFKLIVEKIQIIKDFYEKFLGFSPKIGVAGLNPHCESILRFNEDKEIIYPAIKSLKKKINVKGPFPSDTLFMKNNRKKFDVIIGMYHDQVLGPMKTLFEYDAINITIGLQFLRVTPDHGPNEEMVGKNKSDPTSLIKSLDFLNKK